MDPDKTWAEMVDLAETVLDGVTTDEAAALELAELVLAMRDWLGKGGFPPAVMRRSGR